MVEKTFREEHGRIVGSLARRFGDLDIAEEAAGEALLAALDRWPEEGVPVNPGGWLTTTAARKAIDRLRREARRYGKFEDAERLRHETPHERTGPVEDDRLRLLFVCCHPALAPEARVALTLRMLGGLSVADISRAFLVPETTMAQRITRAKKKIRDERIPFQVPEQADLRARLSGVMSVIYLIYNEGYLAGSTEAAPIRDELSGEAIRLGRLLRRLLPDEPEVSGLLALMLLTEARRPARLARGALVPLGEQDRTLWDRELIAEGHWLVRQCLARNQPGRYQLLAAINAVHTDARRVEETDWGQIATLYSHLEAIAPSPMVTLNRAVAVAELDGPSVALAIVERLAAERPELTRYHAWHVTRADLLRRTGRDGEARAAYDDAIEATANVAERAYLRRQRDRLAT